MRRFNWKRIKPSCRLTRSRTFCPFYTQVKRRRIDLTRAHPTLSGKSSLAAGWFICQQDKIDCSKQQREGINVSQLFLLAYDCFIFSFNMNRANWPVDEFMNRAEDTECKFLMPVKYLVKTYLDPVHSIVACVIHLPALQRYSNAFEILQHAIF